MKRKRLKNCEVLGVSSVHVLHAATVDALDDACLLRILAFLDPMPDRFNAGRVCRRWHTIAGDPRMRLRVDGGPDMGDTQVGSTNTTPPRGEHRDMQSLLDGLPYSTLVKAVQAARPGDTILLSEGRPHHVSTVLIDKPLCLLGSGKSKDDTLLVCPRGAEGALEFHANARIANLSIRAELGPCLVHRRGRLMVENCALECVEHPLEHLVCPIVTTAPAYHSAEDAAAGIPGPEVLLGMCEDVRRGVGVKERGGWKGVVGGTGVPSLVAGVGECKRPLFPKGLPSLGGEGRRRLSSNGVKVVQTRIEGGCSAVKASGGLSLQQVRVMYERAALIFWFSVTHAQKATCLQTSGCPCCVPPLAVTSWES